jgi:hypothetical protein
VLPDKRHPGDPAQRLVYVGLKEPVNEVGELLVKPAVGQHVQIECALNYVSHDVSTIMGLTCHSLHKLFTSI